MKPILSHEAILASAGSGKTFQLAHRYIRLLAAGVEPDRIMAITFSRKAAGEIFESIVTHLCRAAASEEEALRTAERIEAPGIGARDFLRLLRAFLEHLPRVRISTIDSFTIGILRTFPIELGLSPTFDVMDEESVSALQARTEALNSLFHSAVRDRTGQGDLLEAFKQATFGREQKTFVRDFDRFIAEYHAYYKQAPDPSAWGQPDRIWPDGNTRLRPVSDLPAVIEFMRNHAVSGFWNAYAERKWLEFLQALATHQPGMPWNQISYIGERLLERMTELEHGRAELLINRKSYPIENEVARTMARLARHILQQHLHASLQMTQGLFRLLDRFERIYDEQVRRPGRITFDDAPFLLALSGRDLSQSPGDPSRLYIDYRLDGRLDHWLMDEFQDTSDAQWSVFRNLADEVLQDTSGTRSFFMVGDVKQAIYGWRGGNHALFGNILDTYGARIVQRPLNTSFRSAPPVLDTVNRAFAALPEEIPERVNAQWQRVWGTHEPRKDVPPLSGYAALLEVGEDKDDRDARYRACAAILQEVDPLRKGLSVAILVRRNRTAQEVADVLRATCPGLPVAVEGQSAIADNPVVLVLLSLIQHAAHPGDTLAAAHVRMSPLKHAFRQTRPTDLLRALHAHGYQTFIETWGRRMEEVQPLDPFGRRRLEQLIEASGEFDMETDRTPDRYLAFLRGYAFSEQAAESVVRIMTVYKAKGLGFDMVLLPDLPDGFSITRGSDQSLHIARDETQRARWALLLPNRAVRAQDEVLHRATGQADEEFTFEQLCVLYVALTRAKRGLYMLTNPPPKSGEALTFARFLLQQFSSQGTNSGETRIGAMAAHAHYAVGDRNWHADLCAQEDGRAEMAPPELPARFVKKKSHRKRLLRVSPSSRAEAPRAAHLFFVPVVQRSLVLGTAVHGLFEEVEWFEPGSVDEAVRRWTARQMETDLEAIDHFISAMAYPSIQAALTKPDPHAVCWRETPFEFIWRDQWVTGIFDRVVLTREPGGDYSGAMIQDFKTNDVNETTVAAMADHYRPQLELYRRALSRLTGLPVRRIGAQLLCTRPGIVVDV